MNRRGVLGVALLVALLVAPGSSQVSQATPDAPLSVYLTEIVNATLETDGLFYDCGAWNVTGNVTIYNGATERVFDVWLPIWLDTTLTYLTPLSVSEKPSYAYVEVSAPGASIPSWVLNSYPSSGFGDANSMYWVHITELQPGDRVVLTYSIDGASISTCPPIRVSETIDPEKIVDGQTQDIEINITVVNDLPWDVSVKLRKILPPDNGPSDGWRDAAGNPVFTSAGTPTSGGSGLSTDGKQLNWTGDGSWPDGWFTVAANSNENLTGVVVRGTPDLSEVGGSTQKVHMGTIYLRFKLARAISGSRVGYLYAVGDADFEAKKEQDTSTPSNWYETLVVYDTSGTFDYEIVYTKLWATTTANPEGTPIAGSENEQVGSPIAVIGPGEASTSYQYGPFSFSSGSVPKVWAEFKARIERDETYGWMNYTNTTVGVGPDGRSKFIVREMIWVVRGYLVKAKKEVRPGPVNNMTCITIELYNAGEWMTPYVEFYDLIPLNFMAKESDASNESMMFFPIQMLAQDADSNSPPDYSQVVTGLTGYQKGYLWKTYPLPAPQMGFAEWFDGPGAANVKTVTVTLADGSTRQWTVYPVDGSTINVNGTDYAEGSTIAAGGTDFLVSWVQNTLDTGAGKVVVSAKGTYENLNMDVYNPVVVHYCVIGKGDYNLTDIFVVGVDPRNTLDATAVFMPSAGVEFGAATFEQWLVIAVAVLVVVGVLLERRRKSPSQ